jgi:DNA-binding Xre family transcriptional regulator
MESLLRKLDSPTAYALAKRAGIPETTAYRLVDNGGRVTRLEPKLVKKLCKAFDVDPMKLIEWVDD